MFHRRSDKAAALAKVPLFGELNRRHLSELARYVDEVHVDKDRVLTRQGQHGLEFLLIVEGRARVERDGRRIARLDKGDFFGEMSLIDGKPRTATVVAETPMTLLVVHRRAFGELLDKMPGLQKKILVSLSERLREADVALTKRN